MRLGLIAVGAAFTLVGAGVIVAIVDPGDDPLVTRTSTADVNGLTGGSWKPFVLPASSTTPATLTLTWYATTGQLDVTPQVNVSLYAARPCPPASAPCAVDPALETWNGSGPGHWSESTGSGPLYMLYVDVIGGSNVSVNFSATLVEQYRAGPLSLPLVSFAVTMIGGGLLTGVGAVALYLGAFLPRGVYGAPPRRELDELEPLDLGPEVVDDGSGPWAPGPPR